MVCYFVFSFYKTSEKNLENETASLIINSNDLVNSYRTNEEKSDRLYTGKIIEVTGFVKEITFLKLACSELTYKEVADKMCLSPKTIDGYRNNLFVKLNVKNRVGLVMYAIKNKIYTP